MAISSEAGPEKGLIRLSEEHLPGEEMKNHLLALLLKDMLKKLALTKTQICSFQADALTRQVLQLQAEVMKPGNALNSQTSMQIGGEAHEPI